MSRPVPEPAAASSRGTGGQIDRGQVPWSCHGLRSLGTPACDAIAPALVPGVSGDWVQGLSSGGPPPMATYDFELTYDAADGYVILFGGIAASSSQPPTTEMWAFQHGTWRQLSPVNMPENCPGSALAFDDSDGYVLYASAENDPNWNPGCTSANQTWSYSAGTWTQLHPAISPPGRYGASMTNDSSDGYLVLFGGLSATCIPSNYCNDTWRFSAGNWTELFPTNAPSPREEAGLAYDAAIGHPVLFGGSTPAPPFGATDTWEFSAGTWTELFPNASPPWPQPDALSYDAADRELVFTSAWNYSGPQDEVTWVFQNDNWTAVTSPGPAESEGAETAFDYGGGFLLYFSGYGSYGVTNYTWSFLGGTWTPVVAPTTFVATLSIVPGTTDLGVGVSLTTAITGPADSYVYSYGGLPPGCVTADAFGLACVPTAAGSYTITVSVENSTGSFSNSSATLTVVPYLQVTGLQVFPGNVAVDHPTTFTTSTSGGVAPLSYVYTHLPAGCGSADAASFNCTPTALGTYLVIVQVTDSLGAFGETGMNLTVIQYTSGPPPVIAAFDVVPSTIPLGETVTYAVTAMGTGTLSYAFEDLPPGCVNASARTLSCTPTAAGTFVTEVQVSDPIGRIAFSNATLSVTPLGGAGPLSILEFFASPAVVTIGYPAVLEVFVQGGTTPYSYAYTHLPVGCTSLSAANLPCTPSSSGSISITVTVRDAGNGSSASSTLLIILPANATAPAAASAGPSWLEFGLGVSTVALAVALAFSLVTRRSPPVGPP